MPQHASDYIKTLITQRKAVDKDFSVQLMCDDLNLPKSTIDKFLAKQTKDTSWSNVFAMVSYLGGSLDELAGIQTRAIAQEAAAVIEETAKQTGPAELPTLSRLVDSYEKEITRIEESRQQEIARLSAFNDKYLTHVVELVETGRQALIQQHTAAIAHEKELCATALGEKQSHLESFKGGRNAWRALALIASGLLVFGACWLIWEFSNLDLGLTGYLLKQAGLIGAAGWGS